jgi:hypothetical protein
MRGEWRPNALSSPNITASQMGGTFDLCLEFGIVDGCKSVEVTGRARDLHDRGDVAAL